MSNRDFIRLVPQETIDRALAIDAEVLATNQPQFERDNKEIYDLAINTWMLCVQEYAPHSWVYLSMRISRTGLASTVQYCSDAATSFLSGGGLDDYPLVRSVYAEITLGNPRLTDNYKTSWSREGVLLFLCRYLKRLTPIGADVLDTTAKRVFLANQKRLKQICRRGYNPLIIDMCRREVDAGLLLARTRKYSCIRMKDVEISPGTCFSLNGRPLRTLREKVDNLINDYHFDRREVWASTVWAYALGEECRLMTVPKSFKSARTIAPEQCLRQAIAHRMFSLRGRTPIGIDLHDQTPNQRKAEKGSLDASYCTIDLSHASDDVTWTLVQDIYFNVPEYLKYLERIRPKYCNVDGQRHLLHSFATMGNSMTFLVESEIFYIITKAAVHFAQRCGEEIDDEVIVYGDDIIAPNAAYPYVIAFLQSLGFVPNEEKSYNVGDFRESCGKDYLRGQDVTSPYFPRQPLKVLLNWTRNRNSECITVAESLISLQHRLMDVSMRAAQYIELYLLEHKTGLGFKPMGTSSTDLWAYDDIPSEYRLIPEYRSTTRLRKDPWVFRNHQWIYEPYYRSYTKTRVDDEIHRVPMYLRPTVELEQISLPDEILYLQYLAFGPYYQSSFDALLGISTSRRLIPAGKPRSAWKVME